MRRRKMMAKNLQYPQAIKYGRRGREKKSLSDLYDALGPVMHGTERFTNGAIITTVGRQNGQFYAENTVAKIREMIQKSRDSRSTLAATDETAGVVSSFNSDFKFIHLGGSVKHTFKNTCNQTAYVEFVEYTVKRYTKMTPVSAWQFDLDNDNPILNLTTPLDQNLDQVDISARPGKSGYKFNDLYRSRRIGRRIIEPGMEVHITQRIPPMNISTALFEQRVDETLGSADFGPFTTFLGIYLSGEVTTDSADNDVNTGSCKLSHIALRKYSFRAFKFIKRHQHFFNDSLSTTFTQQVHYNPQDESIREYHQEF